MSPLISHLQPRIMIASLAIITASWSPVGNASTSEEAFQINIHPKNYTPKQKANLSQAIHLLEVIMNSEEFKQRVLNHEHKGEFTFYQNRNLSNEQIYETLMAGKESYTTTEDHEMDLNLTMYSSSDNVIGKTYTGSSIVYTNSRYHNYFKPYQIAGNLAHEWSHKLGFRHSTHYTSNRPYSVPYAIGDIVVEIGKRIYNQD